jgi:hypothetical protein
MSKRDGGDRSESLVRAERRRKILELAVQGWSFAEIGTHFGIAESTAHRIWQREVDRFPRVSSREKMRKMSALRLGKARMHASCLMSSADPKTKARGIAALVDIEAREARLFGLDAPVQSKIEEVTNPENMQIPIALARAMLKDLEAREAQPFGLDASVESEVEEIPDPENMQIPIALARAMLKDIEGGENG